MSASEAFPHLGYVYFIQAEGMSRYKVGLSVSPPDRLSHLQTGSPVPLLLKCSYKCRDMVEEEQFWHEGLASLNVHREWFDIPDDLFARIADVITTRALDEARRLPPQHQPETIPVFIDPSVIDRIVDDYLATLNWVLIYSDGIARIAYTENTGKLYIEFTQGTICAFEQVPSHIFECLMMYSSVGYIYREYIYGRFETRVMRIAAPPQSLKE